MEVTFVDNKYIVKFTPSEQALVNEDEQNVGGFLLERLAVTWFVRRNNIFDGMPRTEVENRMGALPSVKKQQIMALLKG